MKRTVLWIVVILIIFVSNSCAPRLTKRYKHMNIETIQDDGSKNIRVSAFTLDISPSTSEISMLQMSPIGQLAFIKEIGKKTNSVGELLKSLGENIGAPKKDGDIIDLTKFKKRVVFSVEKQAFGETNIGPADRIDQLLIKLSNLNQARFVSWNKFETKYEAVDLGKLTSTQEFNFGLDIPFKSSEPTPSLGIGAKQGLAEEVLLRQRYVVLNGRLDEQSAYLYQQGVVGIDLTGNFSVDFTIGANPACKVWEVISLKNLWKENPKTPNSAKDIQISFSQLKYPKSTKQISCDLTYNYSLRHVEKNGHTIIEGDDVVKFKRGSYQAEPIKIKLVGEEELMVRLFYIVTNKDNDKYSRIGYMLHLNQSEKPDDKTPLYFFDYQNAKSFLDWLACSKSLMVGDYEIWLPHRVLVKEDIPGLYVKGKTLNEIED